MNKDDRIARYGEEAYKRKLERERAWYKAHKEEKKANNRKYREEHLEERKEYDKKYAEDNPEKRIANNQEQDRKGGRRYAKKLVYKKTGLTGERNKIRNKHAKEYRQYKQIIAPESQLHHEWIPQTSEYRGVAVVEADAHMHGFVDVIEILDGKITLLTEEEIKKGKKNEKEDI